MSYCEQLYGEIDDHILLIKIINQYADPSEYYFYDFGQFYGTKSVAGNGIVLPAYEPAVFELKKPNENIKGMVR